MGPKVAVLGVEVASGAWSEPVETPPPDFFDRLGYYANP